MRLLKGCLRGALVASTRPVSALALIKTFHLPNSSVGGSKIAARLVSELLAEGSIEGTVKGGALTYTPAVYVAAQGAAVSQFYAQNDYVEYTLCERVGLSSPKTFLRARYPDGVALPSVFVSPGICSQVCSAIMSRCLLSWSLPASLQPGVFLYHVALPSVVVSPSISRFQSVSSALPSVFVSPGISSQVCPSIMLRFALSLSLPASPSISSSLVCSSTMSRALPSVVVSPSVSQHLIQQGVSLYHVALPFVFVSPSISSPAWCIP